MPDPIRIDAHHPGGASIINPAQLNFHGSEVQIALDVDPEQFPLGIEIIVMQPGGLEPLGKILVRTGCMIGVVPPEMAHHLRGMVKKARHLPAGQIDAPGVRG